MSAGVKNDGMGSHQPGGPRLASRGGDMAYCQWPPPSEFQKMRVHCGPDIEPMG